MTAGRIIRWVLGVLFLILGLVGMFLPVLPGFLVILLGATLLSPDVPPIRRGLERLVARSPRLKQALQRYHRQVVPDLK